MQLVNRLNFYKAMTKIQKNLDSQLISDKYCIDSFKLSIDVDDLDFVSIPENYIETSADTGEVIREFKRKSLQVPFDNTTIYLGVHKRILNGKVYSKLYILFSSKIANKDYFSGIKKHHIINVLEFLKQRGYIGYTSVSEVFKKLFTLDTDIKKDFVFDIDYRDIIANYNKELVKQFQYEKCEIHNYKSAINLGIQTFNRERSTCVKPFVKWYDKNKELRGKHEEFFGILPEDVRNILTTKFVYRFEFTMKDKKFFANFDLSNRLEDVLEISEDKWREVAKSLLQTLFHYKVKKMRDTTKLNYYEKILAIYLFESIQKNNISVDKAKSMFTRIQKKKEQKFKASILFDKIYQSITVGSEVGVYDDYNRIKQLDELFGLV